MRLAKSVLPITLALGLWGLSVAIAPTMAQVPAPDEEPNWGSDRPVDIDAYRKALMIGIWRGFQSSQELTLYYGCELRGDGTFTSRQRVYRQEAVLEDRVGQGKWDFDGKILAVTGVNLGAKPEAIALRFELGKDGYLYYREGNLSDRYRDLKLGKLSSQ